MQICNCKLIAIIFQIKISNNHNSLMCIIECMFCNCHSTNQSSNLNIKSIIYFLDGGYIYVHGGICPHTCIYVVYVYFNINMHNSKNGSLNKEHRLSLP